MCLLSLRILHELKAEKYEDISLFRGDEKTDHSPYTKQEACRSRSVAKS